MGWKYITDITLVVVVLAYSDAGIRLETLPKVTFNITIVVVAFDTC